MEHRLEFVAEIAGVRYYNDSKATNVDATLKALEAFPGRILVILGGKDKGSDYSVVAAGLCAREAILALLIGAPPKRSKSRFPAAWPSNAPEHCERAVEIASQAAQPGDVVLLAPACASFDQFENYEHRGRVFKELVRKREQRSADAPPQDNGKARSWPDGLKTTAGYLASR